MAKKGTKFNSYDYDLKYKVVQDYLSGKSGGMKAVARKL